MSYDPNIPTGTVPLNQDYLNLRSNFQQLDTVYKVDHLAFTNTTLQLGYHTAIHLIPQAPPGAVLGVGQLFSQTVGGGDQDLFWISGNGVTYRLTGAQQATPGFAFIGGLLMSWGVATVNTLGTATTISFPLAYTSAADVYSITIGPINSSGNSPSANSVFVKSGTVTASGFTVTNSSSGSITSIYWMAIGRG